MRLSDLESLLKTPEEKMADFNKKQGTREANITKDDVLKGLSGNIELPRQKQDEFFRDLKEEIKSFFDKNFFDRREVSNE